jgi:hypothetical protein
MQYNGWTNYETWRVMLEIFDGLEDDMGGPEALKDFAEDVICESAPEGLARDYALAFLSEVNWYEIAKVLSADDEEAA